MSHLTPEQLEASGVHLVEVAPGTPEYARRIKARLPLRPPAFRVGDWATTGYENRRIVHASWDGFGAQWVYSVPGMGAPWLSPARAGLPFVEYVQTAPGSHCWRARGER